MRYVVPLLIDADRNPLGLFSVSTSKGEVVILFSNKAVWERFAASVSRVLKKQNQFLGSADFEGDSIDDVADKLVEIDPTLSSSATFLPDTAPAVKDVLTYFQQHA